MSRFFRGALLAVPTLLLAACGGGGGDASTPAPTVSALVITSSNSKAVAADALSASTNVDAADAGTSLVTAVQVESGSGAGSPLQLAAAARKVASLAPATAPVATGVAYSETVNCDLGGTLTFSGDVSGGSALVAGDTMTVSASGCKASIDGVTTVMSGSMTLSIVSGSYDSATMTYPKRLVMKIATVNFSLTAGSETSVSNGDLQIDLTETSATAATLVLTGSALSNATGSHTATLKNYRQSVTTDGSTITLDVSATVESTNSRLGSTIVSYTVSTLTPITMNAAGDYTAGSLKVTGSNSGLQLTVTSTNAFTVQVDADGNGSYETSNTATLAELQSLI